MASGFAAVGAMVISAFGGTAAVTAAGAAAVTLANVAVGVAASAVVGAAIGGISAAVMGGDIGQGMLFGAIGGVVTGGLAGGSLAGGMSGVGVEVGASVAPVSGLGGPTVGMAGAYGTAGGAAASEAATAGAANFFGGAFAKEIGKNTIGAKLMEKAVDFGVGALAPQPETPWGETQAGKEALWAHQKELQEMSSSSSSAGSSAKMPYQNTQEGFREQLAHDTAQMKLQGEQRLQEVDKTYALQKENTMAEYDKQAEKFTKAAGVAGEQEFVGSSDETKAAILAKQQAKQEGMLQGAPQIGEEESNG